MFTSSEMIERKGRITESPYLCPLIDITMKSGGGDDKISRYLHSLYEKGLIVRRKRKT